MSIQIRIAGIYDADQHLGDVNAPRFDSFQQIEHQGFHDCNEHTAEEEDEGGYDMRFRKNLNKQISEQEEYQQDEG